MFEKFGFVALYELYNLRQSARKFREILLVKEYLVPVETDASVAVDFLAALGNREVIIVAACRPDIEKIGSASGFHRFRKNLVALFLGFAIGSCVGRHIRTIIGLIMRI